MKFCVERRCIWDGASTQNDVPARARSRARGDPGFVVLLGVGFFPPGVLRLAGGPGSAPGLVDINL